MFFSAHQHMQQWQEKNLSQQFVPFVMKFRDAATRPLPPPTSASKGKKKSDPTYLRQRRSPYAELSIASPVKGTNLTKKMSNTSCLPWCVGRWEMTAAWTRGFVRLTQKATVSERNATVTSFHQSSSLCSLLLHFQSRQLERQRKRMIITGTITRLV